VAAFAIVLGNLLADLAIPLIEPRIKLRRPSVVVVPAIIYLVPQIHMWRRRLQKTGPAV